MPYFLEFKATLVYPPKCIPTMNNKRKNPTIHSFSLSFFSSTNSKTSHLLSSFMFSSRFVSSVFSLIMIFEIFYFILENLMCLAFEFETTVDTYSDLTGSFEGNVFQWMSQGPTTSITYHNLALDFDHGVFFYQFQCVGAMLSFDVWRFFIGQNKIRFVFDRSGDSTANKARSAGFDTTSGRRSRRTNGGRNRLD
mmetsp:Transcript_5161/g.7478  ORF Transcript_5161/g.7478 Transcript_5161/m.7478 type:complete len:195 (+) Transcript_5161:144-728(+)